MQLNKTHCEKSRNYAHVIEILYSKAYLEKTVLSVSIVNVHSQIILFLLVLKSIVPNNMLTMFFLDFEFFSYYLLIFIIIFNCYTCVFPSFHLVKS